MLLIGVAGTTLSAQEVDWLQDDAVAGVVLFKRNFASRAQIVELSAALREAAPRPLLLAVDQEGVCSASMRAIVRYHHYRGLVHCMYAIRRRHWSWRSNMLG